MSTSPKSSHQAPSQIAAPEMPAPEMPASQPATGPQPAFVGERRSTDRFKTAFRASCLVADGRAVIAMIKNMSRAGVMVQTDTHLRVGQSVSYFWDEKRMIPARVAWSDGPLHGLENEEEHPVYDNSFAYRSVRVPCANEADVWVDGARHRPQLANVSLGGAQLVGLQVRVGALMTLCVGGVELTNVSARWSHPAHSGQRARTGVSFAQRLNAAELSGLIASAGVEIDTGAAARTQSVIDDVLAQ